MALKKKTLSIGIDELVFMSKKKTKNVTFSIRITAEQDEKLRMLARQKGLSANALVSAFIEIFLRDFEEKEKTKAS